MPSVQALVVVPGAPVAAAQATLATAGAANADETRWPQAGRTHLPDQAPDATGSTRRRDPLQVLEELPPGGQDRLGR